MPGVLEVDARDVPDREPGTDARARAAAQSREWFRGVFEESPIGMLLLDCELRLLLANQAFCEIAGYTHEQLMAMSSESFAHPVDTDDELGTPYNLFTGESQPAVSERRLIHSSGRTLAVAVRTSVLYGPEGIARHYLIHVQDITALKHHQRQLHFLSSHDALTGTLNRRAFMRAIRQGASLAGRERATAGAVLVIDLDQFKFLNDALGSEAADELIERAAAVIAAELQQSDVLARLGGDEFGVLLAHAGRSEALRVAGILLHALRRERIHVGGMRRALTASIGIATFHDAEHLGGEEVLGNADLAMYDAKAAGRDRVALFDAADTATTAGACGRPR